MDELSRIILCLENELLKMGITVENLPTKIQQCIRPTTDETIEAIIAETIKQMRKTFKDVRTPKPNYIAAKDIGYRGNLNIDWEAQEEQITTEFGRKPQQGELYITIEGTDPQTTLTCYGLTHTLGGKPNPHVFVYTAREKTIVLHIPQLITQAGLNDFIERAYKWDNLMGVERGETQIFQELKKIYIKTKGKIQEINV